MKNPDTVVVVVDTQLDFMMNDGRLPVAGAEAIIAPGIRFLASLDPAVVAGVVMTFDTHREEEFIGSPENLGNPDAGEPGFPIHCELGTPGWENVFNSSAIPNGIPIYQLEKSVFDMWAMRNVTVYANFPHFYDDQTKRDGFFDRLITKGVTKAIVIGVAADFCVKYAIDGLLKRGFEVTVPAHLTRGIIRQIDQVAAEDFAGAALTISE